MFHAPVDGAIDRLTIPMLSMVPTEDGLFDLYEYRQLEARSSRVTVLPVPDSADLMIYRQTDFIMDRISERVSGARQPSKGSPWMSASSCPPTPNSPTRPKVGLFGHEATTTHVFDCLRSREQFGSGRTGGQQQTSVARPLG
ncbi:hypothetical protein [Primorskyibacter sp. 2E107]|uniref:hypothetical protein n=1 Tax=Primorskyibacter sp. 2E107 TaxID=3403458 RepID=UPI003AF845AD